MIESYLRRLTVRRRIFGGMLILVFLAALSIPIILNTQAFLFDRLEQVTNVETRSDRLLLLAVTRIASSRTNLLRYVKDYAPSTYQALDDIDQATQLLEETQALIDVPDQTNAVALILDGLTDYRLLIGEIELARQNGNTNTSQLEFQAYRLGNDLAQRIELIVSQSELRVASTNQAILQSAQTRTIVILGGYVILLGLVFVLARFVERSISRPISDLQAGADAFRQGRLEERIPTIGSDELTALAQDFNRMADQLSELYRDQEQIIANRTRALETSMQVSRRLSTILDQDRLVRDVVEQLQVSFGYYHAQIYLFDDSQQNLLMVGGTGQAGRTLLDRGHKIEIGRGLVGQSAASNQVVLIPDVSQYPDWLPNPLLPETKAELAVPITIGADVLGVLDVQHNEADGLGQEDADLIQAVASQVAIAVQNAQAYTRAQQRAEREARIIAINQRIQSATTIDDVLKIAVRELGQALGTKRADVEVKVGSLVDGGQQAG